MKWALALALASAAADTELDQVLLGIRACLGQDRAPLLNALARFPGSALAGQASRTPETRVLKEDGRESLRRRARKRGH
jgi:hypothetical protein